LKTNVYTPYEAGIRELLERLGCDHPRRVDALIYQQRLTENLDAARRDGDSETLRAERAQIVTHLDSLALDALGISYSALCRPDDGTQEAALTLGEGSPPSRVDTGGGAYVAGDVIIEHGDFVGRDQVKGASTPPTDDLESLRRRLSEARENLALILERKGEYVLRTDVPLQLIKEERRLTRRIRALEDEIEQARPITLLRQATKLLTERMAHDVYGMAWKSLKQRLLTQASRIPMERHLDVAALERAADDLARLNHETIILLEALRIEGNPGQLGAVEHHAALIAVHVLAIYRLSPGDAPELDRLAASTSASPPAQNRMTPEGGTTP
jgi:hypothetical protein